MNIFKDFLYSDFLFKFQKLFVFTRFDIENKMRMINNVRVKIMHTRFTWDDKIYREFMLHLLKELQPRLELKGSIFMEENENCYEVIFFESGTYYIGYVLNNHHYWELKQ